MSDSEKILTLLQAVFQSAIILMALISLLFVVMFLCSYFKFCLEERARKRGCIR